MQLRCYRCGWSFAIKKEEVTFAIETLEGSGGVHYDVRCPRCRHTNKISLEQLQQAAPKVEEVELEAEAEEEEGEEN
jgi:phage FluMu protein Com